MSQGIFMVFFIMLPDKYCVQKTDKQQSVHLNFDGASERGESKNDSNPKSGEGSRLTWYNIIVPPSEWDNTFSIYSLKHLIDGAAITTSSRTQIRNCASIDIICRSHQPKK